MTVASGEGWTLIHGDCLQVLPTLDAGSVDAVITDPPFLKKNLGLYGQMASCLPRILKPGGSLFAMVPHFGIAHVLPAVSEYLKWRWLFCMWQEKGKHPRMAMGIEVMWFPVGWWVNGSWPTGRGFIRDGFENTPVVKTFHPWEKSPEWAEHCIKTVPLDGVVLDCFAGSGSTGVACLQTGRRFIGIELDAAYFEVARQRLEAVSAQARLAV
jgi:site-specific DNA-methyltransferase (adenine-specific)